MNKALKNTTGKDAKTMNYWWGMSAGVIDVNCSKNMPAGLCRLVEEFKKLLRKNEFNPFEGEIIDQNGKCHGQAGEVLTNEEIITMNWLCNNVVGSIPSESELTDKGAALARIQGVSEENA